MLKSPKKDCNHRLGNIQVLFHALYSVVLVKYFVRTRNNVGLVSGSLLEVTLV